jgi:hypothetical protein
MICIRKMISIIDILILKWFKNINLFYMLFIIMLIKIKYIILWLGFYNIYFIVLFLRKEKYSLFVLV